MKLDKLKELDSKMYQLNAKISALIYIQKLNTKEEAVAYLKKINMEIADWINDVRVIYEELKNNETKK